MLSLRAHAWICGALFAALILIPLVGNLLQAAGVPGPSGAFRLPFQIFYMTLFLGFGLSTVPVVVKTVLRAQRSNAGVPPIAALIRHQNTIIWVMWILVLGGLAVALPVMIQDGFFSGSPR